MKFLNRAQAGVMLAERAMELKLRDPIVLALPRGGLPVAYEIARVLGAPLDVLVVRKVGAPGNEEFGVGAVAEKGITWLDPKALRHFHAYLTEIQGTVAKETREVARRVEKYRHGRALPPLKGRSVVLVDDGLATGVTARAALQYLRQEGVGQIVLAVPVCAPPTAEFMRSQVDELLCLDEPKQFFAVGQFYENFPQLSDEEAVDYLHRARVPPVDPVRYKELEEKQKTSRKRSA